MRWAIILAVLVVIAACALYDPSAIPSDLHRASYQCDLNQLSDLLPLHSMSQRGTAEADQLNAAAKERLKSKANARDRWNNTPLHWAAKGGKPSCAEAVAHLIKAGADPLATNNGGSTALHWAASIRDGVVARDIIRLLLSHGLDVSAKNHVGETPLHWAVDWAQPEAVKELLKQGAEKNAVDENGNTPLHKIKKDCHEREDCSHVVSLLVSAGSDITLRNNFGRMALSQFDQAAAQRLTSMVGAEATFDERAANKIKETKAKAEAEDQARKEAEKQSTPQPPAQLSDEEVARIQKDLEEFKKNLTQGTT